MRSAARLPWPALGLLCLGLCTWLWTLAEPERCGPVTAGLEAAPPTWSCPTGYDALGRCIVRTLAGGTHAFLAPGMSAALVAALLGSLGGLAAGYSPPLLQRGVGALLTVLEAIPRLLVLLLVYLLLPGSWLALGVATGLTQAPALAWDVRGRIAQLEATEYILAARAHGLPSSRIALHHVLWKSCRRYILHHTLLAIGALLVAETTLSYALSSGLEIESCSWGSTLQRTLYALYDLLAMRLGPRGPGLEGGPPDAGLLSALPFLAVVATLLGSLWALHRLGTWLSEREDAP